MDRSEFLTHEKFLLKELELLHLHLQIAHAGISVAAAALRYQSADRDVDVACVLTHDVGDRIEDQIERTVRLIAQLQPFNADLAEELPGELQRVPLQ